MSRAARHCHARRSRREPDPALFGLRELYRCGQRGVRAPRIRHHLADAYCPVPHADRDAACFGWQARGGRRARAYRQACGPPRRHNRLVMTVNPHLGWNIVADVRQLLEFGFMVNAYRAGTIVAVVAGALGWFMVLRRQAFAGHTLAIVSFPGAAAAILVGVSAV